MDYRVELEAYTGPLDLLLYLVKRDEVDIYDIPIAKITDQYQQFLELMQELNLNLAGEFMVMAATLMEIKSQMLLPSHEPGPEGEEEEDPRAELVRELIAYREFREAANTLGTLAYEQGKKFTRQATERPGEHEVERPLEEVSIWDIFAAFNRLMQETLGRMAVAMVGEKVSVEECVRELLGRLSAAGKLAFREAFEGAHSRPHLVGYFLALLELVRRQALVVEQPEPFGEIYLRLARGTADPGRQAWA